MATVRLREIAHARSGDKGRDAMVSIIPWERRHYALLARVLTPERIKAHCGGGPRGGGGGRDAPPPPAPGWGRARGARGRGGRDGPRPEHAGSAGDGPRRPPAGPER